MASTARKNDYGSTIVLTLYEGTSAVDISAATTKNFIIVDPDGAASTKTAAFVTDGSDGKLTWTITTGFLSTAGKWKVMATATDSSTFQYSTTVATFRVSDILS